MTVRNNVLDAVRSLVDKEGSRVKFADKLGVSKQTVNNWVNGANAPDIEMIAEIARIFRVPLSAILNGEVTHDENTIDASKNSFVDVPLYGSIAAGVPIEMIAVDDYHPIPAPMHDRYPDAFLLRVSGESMNRILPNGCYALVDPREEVVKDNDPYAVCVNGFDATIKRVNKLANGFQLVPDSTDPTYPVQTFNYNEPGTETITVIGKVVWYVIPFDWGF